MILIGLMQLVSCGVGTFLLSREFHLSYGGWIGMLLVVWTVMPNMGMGVKR